MTVKFQFEGQDFLALNGGPIFKFSEAISFVVDCETQEEVDKYWNALSAHPESEQCDWLKDKFGLSWQIVPKQLGEMLGDKDPAKAGQVMQAKGSFVPPSGTITALCAASSNTIHIKLLMDAAHA